MAFVPKKNVKWSIEALPVSDYTKLQKVTASTKSIPLNKTSHPIMSSTTATRAGFTTLPSLAPLSGQDISEVNVLTSLSQPTHVGMNAVFGQREQDRKARREIANSNERRRMQSINAGFKSLKGILPQIAAGEKLSKAAILQQTAEHIVRLNAEKSKILILNEKLRTALSECKCDNPKRRSLMKSLISDEKDEGIGSPRDDEFDDMGRDSVEIRLQLDKEKRVNLQLQEKVRELEARLRLVDASLASSDPHLCANDTTTTQILSRPHHIIKREAAEHSITSLFNQPTPAFVPDFSQQVVVPCSDTGSTLSHVDSSNPIATPCLAPIPEMLSKVAPVQNKSATNIPRSSQPLKKRAIESVEGENSKNKVAKFQSNSPVVSPIAVHAPTKPIVCNTSQGAVFLQHPSAPVIAVAEPQRPVVSVTLQPPDVSRLSQEKLVSAAGVINGGQQINLTDSPILLSAHPANHPTYFTLSPSLTWAETQVHSPNYSFALKPTNPTPLSVPSHYVLQTASAGPPGHPEEITLNQLNALPSLSKSLAQLNPVPAVHRLNVSEPPAVPSMGARDFPVVAMDTVLNQQGERRTSSTTTATIDSAPSDDDSKTVDERVASLVTVAASSTSRRSKSDPGMPQAEFGQKEVVLSTPLSSAPFPVITNGPGSPLYRHIDTVATRRNLETIVQAIDHLEQQERRNSQDRQSSN